MKLTYDTLCEAVNGLTKMGYTRDFNLNSDGMHYAVDAIRLSPEEFKIDHVFRFEGMTNPDDSSILFAISSLDNSVKGTMVNAYGAYSDPQCADMMSNLTCV